MLIPSYPNWKTNFDSKNGRKWIFSCKTKASKSFIPMRRIWLWHPIMKRMEIIMWIHVYPNWKMNFNSKKWWKTKFFLETKGSIHLSQWGKWICGAQSLKERRLLYESMLILIERWTLIVKKVKRKAFLVKPKHQFFYPNEWNEFMLPNH